MMGGYFDEDGNWHGDSSGQVSRETASRGTTPAAQPAGRIGVSAGAQTEIARDTGGSNYVPNPYSGAGTSIGVWTPPPPSLAQLVSGLKSGVSSGVMDSGGGVAGKVLASPPPPDSPYPVTPASIIALGTPQSTQEIVKLIQLTGNINSRDAKKTLYDAMQIDYQGTIKALRTVVGTLTQQQIADIYQVGADMSRPYYSTLGIAGAGSVNPPQFQDVRTFAAQNVGTEAGGYGTEKYAVGGGISPYSSYAQGKAPVVPPVTAPEVAALSNQAGLFGVPAMSTRPIPSSPIQPAPAYTGSEEQRKYATWGGVPAQAPVITPSQPVNTMWGGDKSGQVSRETVSRGLTAEPLAKDQEGEEGQLGGIVPEWIVDPITLKPDLYRNAFDESRDYSGLGLDVTGSRLQINPSTFEPDRPAVRLAPEHAQEMGDYLYNKMIEMGGKYTELYNNFVSGIVQDPGKYKDSGGWYDNTATYHPGINQWWVSEAVWNAYAKDRGMTGEPSGSSDKGSKGYSAAGGGYSRGGGDYSGGGGTAGGGGGAAAIGGAWNSTYAVDTAPVWWQGLTPGTYDDTSKFLMYMNSLIPVLSPEDQQSVAQWLYRTEPSGFAAYANIAFPPPPSEMTTGLREQFTSSDRARTLLETFNRMVAATGKSESDLGAGYTYLRQVANILNQFGGGPVGLEDYQSRENYLQQMTALNALKTQAVGALEPYTTPYKYLTEPTFTAGPVVPVTKSGDEWIFGKVNPQYA